MKIFNNRNVASSRLSWLVAYLRIFRLVNTRKFDASLLWPLFKSSKWNSRPLYYSQLYGNSNLAIKCRNYTNFAFSLPFECLQTLIVYTYVHQIQNWRNAIWVKKEFFSLHIAICTIKMLRLLSFEDSTWKPGIYLLRHLV